MRDRQDDWGLIMTAVVVDGQKAKDTAFLLNTKLKWLKSREVATDLFAKIPFGIPNEPLPSKEALGFRVPLYGFDQWKKLFTSRQLLALGTFVKWTGPAGHS